MALGRASVVLLLSLQLALVLLLVPGAAAAEADAGNVGVDGATGDAGGGKTEDAEEDPQNIFVAYAALMVMAAVPIWIGSHRSLQQTEIETMSSHDAMMFPVIASCVLFGLYLAFKFLAKEYINMMLRAYFCLLGFAAITAALVPVVELFLPRKVRQDHPWKFQFTLPLTTEPVKVGPFGLAAVIAACLSLGITVWYATEQHWIANNVFGLAFSIEGIEHLSLGSFRTAAILLSGLFFYDIFWVFGTEVMVSVAKGVEGPIKVLFPRDYADPESKFSMLGLGDIVLPGVFVALMIHFDARRRRRSNRRTNPGRVPTSRPYFLTCFIAYVLGLATTMGVMHVFKAAQPALLYLVPFCILSVLALAVYRGELRELWSFEVVPEEDAAASAAAADKSKQKKSKKA